MTPTKIKIQKTSRGVYIAMHVLKCFLIFGLVMLILVSIWYADACTGGVWAPVQGVFPSLLGAMVAVFPEKEALLPAFFVSLILQMVYMGIMIAGAGTMSRLFQDISRTGTPFAERYIRPVRKAAKLAVAMFVVRFVKYGIDAAMEAGVVGFYPDIDLGWVAVLALVYCLICIYDYGCQLQRESDETL